MATTVTTTAQNLEMTFRGETAEVGLYLAMAKKAELEGYPEVALYMRQVAMEEAWHAAEVAGIAGMISDTKSNLEKLVKGETGAYGGKSQASQVAHKEGKNQAAEFFARAADDENRHRAGFQSMLTRLSVTK